MATPTLTPGFTVISTCDATTGWSGSNTVDSEFYKQGTAGLSAILRSNGNNVRQFTWSGNLTNTHIRLWFSYAAPGVINTKANGGIRLHAVTSTGTIYWYLGGSDTYGGGWTLLTVDTSRTPDSGSGNLANVTAVGFTINLVSAPRNAINTWYDYLVYGNGMTITGGSTSDAVTLADIYNVDNSNGYGAVQRINGVYFVSTNLTIGGSTDTYVEDDGQIIVFEDQPVNANLYNITPLGSATTSFKIRNSVIKSASTNTRFDLILDNAGLNTLEFTGNTVANADAIQFKSGQSVTGNVFNNCSLISPNGCSFSNNTISNYTGTSGALLWPESNVSSCAFNNNSNAIEIATDYLSDGVEDFISLTFSSNTYDVNNTTGSAITVNKLSGTNASTYNTANSIVTFVVSATLTINNLYSGTEVRIHRKSDGTLLGGIENATTVDTDNAGRYKYDYAYTTAEDVYIQVLNLNYIYQKIDYSLSGVDETLKVFQQIERNYLNP